MVKLKNKHKIADYTYLWKGNSREVIEMTTEDGDVVTASVEDLEAFIKREHPQVYDACLEEDIIDMIDGTGGYVNQVEVFSFDIFEYESKQNKIEIIQDFANWRKGR